MQIGGSRSTVLIIMLDIEGPPLFCRFHVVATFIPRKFQQMQIDPNWSFLFRGVEFEKWAIAGFPAREKEHFEKSNLT